MNHEDYFKEAGKEASKALCKRDKCGAIIVINNKIIGRGYNAPPKDMEENCKCDLDLILSKKKKSDRTCCLHAEWRAIIDAIKKTPKLSGSTLYFVRVDESGNLKYSKEPYCTVCSRLVLDVDIKLFGLWTIDGPKLFPTKEYNDMSYSFHGSE